MTSEERYVACRDEIGTDEEKTWEDWSVMMEIDVPTHPTDESPKEERDAWTAYVLERHSVKTTINTMARSRKANWRILCLERGVTVVKNLNLRLVRADVPKRAQRIAQHMMAAKGEVGAFLEMADLLVEGRNYCQQISALLKGAMAFMHDLALTSELPEEDREKLTSIFDEHPDKQEEA